MKLKFAFLALLAVLALGVFSSVAAAEVRLFKDFKADVPAGWRVIDEGGHVVFSAPDESAVVTVTIQDAQAMSAKGIAETMSKGLKGTAPIWDEGSGGYIFDFISNEKLPGKALVKVYNGTALVLAIMGDNPEVDALVRSMGDK